MVQVLPLLHGARDATPENDTYRVGRRGARHFRHCVVRSNGDLGDICLEHWRQYRDWQTRLDCSRYRPIFSLLIGCGLVVLMFLSSRRGYDEAADPFRRKKGAPRDE